MSQEEEHEVQSSHSEATPQKGRKARKVQHPSRKYDFSCIRQLRNDRNLTIEKFAKKCGLSYAPISRIETNLIKPNLETLDKIAIGLGMSTHSLLQLAEIRELTRLSGKTAKAGASHLVMFSFADATVGYGTLRKGTILADIESAMSESKTIVVRAGRLRIETKTSEFEASTGDGFNFDASQKHKIMAIEDTEVVIVFRPVA